MTFQLVHTGKGKVERRELPAFVDTSLDVPRKPQKLSGVAKFLLGRNVMERDKIKRAFKTYLPKPLAELDIDQCSFIPGDDRVMCGCKTVRGKSSASYCADHYAIVYSRRAA